MITEADAREIALEMILTGDLGHCFWQQAEEEDLQILSCAFTGNSRWTVKVKGWLPECDMTGWFTIYLTKDGESTGYKYSYQVQGQPMVDWIVF